MNAYGYTIDRNAPGTISATTRFYTHQEIIGCDPRVCAMDETGISIIHNVPAKGQPVRFYVETNLKHFRAPRELIGFSQRVNRIEQLMREIEAIDPRFVTYNGGQRA